MANNMAQQNLNIANKMLSKHNGPKVYDDSEYGTLECQVVPFPSFHFCNMKGCNNDELYISYRNNKLDFDMCIYCQKNKNNEK